MARILITGAHGFIGKHLAHWHASQGDQVCGLGHGIWLTSEAASWGMTHWINGDINAGNLRLLQQVTGTPDRIYHLAGGSSVGAAIANPREDFFRTVATTVELLEWLRQDAPTAKLVAISSAAVYGADHDGQIAEDARLTPYSPYGYHKLMMEELCHSYASSYGLQVSVARLFSVFGPGLKKQLLWDFCTKLASGISTVELGGTGEELRDWTDVRDVVRALDLLGTMAGGKFTVANVGSGIGTSVRQIAERLLHCWCGPGGSEIALQFSGQSRPGDPFRLVAQPARLQSLGFEWQFPVFQGLADYVRWYMDELKRGTA